MSDALVKALLEAMTDEQKAELVEGLLAKAIPPSGVVKLLPQAKKPIKLEREEVLELGSRPIVNEDFTVTRPEALSKGKRPVQAKQNQWSDNGYEGRDDKTKLTKEQMELMAKTRAERSRPEPEAKRSVNCHVCGKAFEIDPAAIYGEYIRCDRCVRR